MKKFYQEPELIIHIYDVSDVVMADGGGGTLSTDDNKQSLSNM